MPGTARRPERPLLPYDGSRTEEHLGDEPRHGGHEIRSYGADRSGKISYRFNSLGFRGEEYRPAAGKHVFVCGPSTAFGTGLPLEASWPHLFKVAYARHHALPPDEVNLLNFSQGGAGNDYMVRTAMTQCARVKPDLLLVELAPGHSRTEYFSSEVTGSDRHLLFGAWLFGDDGSVRPKIKEEHPEILGPLLGYFDYYSDEIGVMSTVKAVLLLQLYCKVQSIPYLVCWGWREGAASDISRYRSHISIAPLLDLVDWQRVFPHAIADDCIDKAADGYHAGAESCARYAQRLWQGWKRLAD